MRRLALALGLAAVGCGEDGLTQTVVVIDGDREVRDAVEELELVVEGGPAGLPFAAVTEETRVLPTSALDLVMPAQHPVRPLGDDANRLFRATATADVGGSTVTGRVITGFQAGESLVARIFLSGDCIDVRCDQDETCDAGRCVSAYRPPEELAPFEPDADASMSDLSDGSTDGDGGPGTGVFACTPTATQIIEGSIGQVDAAQAADGTLRVAWSSGGALRSATVDSGSELLLDLGVTPTGPIGIGPDRDGRFPLVSNNGAYEVRMIDSSTGATLGRVEPLTNVSTLALSSLIATSSGWLLMVRNGDGAPVVFAIDEGGVPSATPTWVGPSGTTWYRLRSTELGPVASWRVGEECSAIRLNEDGSPNGSAQVILPTGCFDPDIDGDGSGFLLAHHQASGAERIARAQLLGPDLTPMGSPFAVSSTEATVNANLVLTFVDDRYWLFWRADETGLASRPLERSGAPLDPVAIESGDGTVDRMVTTSRALFFTRSSGTGSGLWLRCL